MAGIRRESLRTANGPAGPGEQSLLKNTEGRVHVLVDAAEALFGEGYSRFEITRVVHQALKERERQQ